MLTSLRPTWLQGPVLAALTCLLAVAVFFVLAMKIAEHTARQTMDYDIAWTGATARLEAAQLDRDIATYLASREASDAEAVNLSYQILVGRIRIWNDGEYRKFIDRSAKRGEKLERLSAAIKSIKPDIEQISSLTDFSKLRLSLKEVRRLVDRLGSEAHTESVENAEAIRSYLAKQHLLQKLFFSVALGIALLLALLTGLQNRSLINSRRIAEARASDYAFLATHDPLTGLLNRTGFGEALKRLVEETDDDQLAVITMDLDGFKTVNDLCGHATGDMVLLAVSSQLSQILCRWGSAGTAARFGGDEFLMILRVKDQGEALSRAAEIHRDLQPAFHVPGTIMKVDATLGFAVREPGQPWREVVLNADLALGTAKAQGKARVMAYDSKIRSSAIRRNTIKTDLDRALAEGLIEPFYQPQVDLETAKIISVEALARWCHPELGWISPAEFISIAESSGQIVDLGKHIIVAACRDASSFPSHVSLAVNLSAAQLTSHDLIPTVVSALTDSGLAPSRLTLEVTESILISDQQDAIRILDQLKQLGVSISLDDFGSGFSALSYLHSFEWDELKIDRSLVRSLDGSDNRSTSILKAVLALSQDLGLKLIAEGIETPTQLHQLRTLGVTVGQGFLFGPALPVEKLASLLLCSFITPRGGEGTETRLRKMHESKV